MQPLIIGDCSSDSLLWSMPLSLWTSAPQGKRHDEQEGPEFACCIPISDYKSFRGPAILLSQALAIIF
jgi:hypothetical protein